MSKYYEKIVDLVRTERSCLMFESGIRAKQVNFTQTCKTYKDDYIDGQKIRISVK